MRDFLNILWGVMFFVAIVIQTDVSWPGHFTRSRCVLLGLHLEDIVAYAVHHANMDYYRSLTLKTCSKA